MSFVFNVSIDINSIKFDISIWKFVINSYKKYIFNTKNGLFSNKPKKFFQSREIKERYILFAQKHIQDLSDELRNGNLDWNNENCKLFFDLMREKYNISTRDCLTTILYMHTLLNYRHLCEYMKNCKVRNIEGIFNHFAVYIMSKGLDNLNNESKFLFQRFMNERGIKIGFLNSIDELFLKSFNSMKMNQFEEDLIEERNRSDKSIGEKIVFLKKQEFFDAANKYDLDANIENYNIIGSDFSRDSRIDRYYRKHVASVMLETFNGHCVKCNRFYQSLELDHFWQPKSGGGNFAMRHKENGYVNNCIPLCKSCNSSKGKKSFLNYFPYTELEEIIPISQSLNSKLNAIFSNFQDDDIVVSSISANCRDDNL